MSLKSSARTVGIAAGCAAVLTGVLLPVSADAAQTTTTNSFGCTVVTTPASTQHVAATSHDVTTTEQQSTQQQQSRWKTQTEYLPLMYKYQKQQDLTEYSSTIPGTAEVDKNQVEYWKPGTAAQFKTVYTFSAQAQTYERQNPGKQATSHQEFQFKKTSVIYTVEHKQVQYTGNDRNLISWLNANGTQVSTGVWQLKDSVVNAAGINPLAPGIYYNGPFSTQHVVDVHSYGYPGHASLPYNITGVDISTTPPAGSFVESETPVTVYLGANDQIVTSAAQAAWLTANPGDDWVQFNQKTVSNNDGVAPYMEYASDANGDVTTNVANAALLVTPPTGTGWTAFGTPVKVYRTANGSSSTNPADAGKFDSSTPPAGYTLESTEQEQTQAATPDEYLHDNGDGTATLSTNPADLSWIDESATSFGGIDLSTLTKATDQDGNVLINKVVVTPATPAQTIYLKADAQGNLSTTTDPLQATWFKTAPDLTFGGYDWTVYGTGTVTVYAAIVNGVETDTEDSTQASWIDEGDPSFDPTGWDFVRDQSGEPVVQPDVDHPVLGDILYFDPKHESQPTTTLTDENWGTIDPNTLQASKDADIVWTLVDQRNVTVPLPPKTITSVVIDSQAHDVTTPATSTVTWCPPVQASSLAHTGTNAEPGLLFGGGFVAAGGLLGGIAALRRRRLRKAYGNK